MTPLELINLDGMHERFTAGAPEDEIDEPHAPVLGQTDDDHVPVEPVWSGPTAAHSELDLSKMVHWHDGTMNTAAKKSRFTNATQHISWQRLEQMSNHRIKAEYVAEEWAHHGFHHTKPPVKTTDFFMRTPPGGAWYRTEVRHGPTSAAAAGASHYKEFQIPTQAFHACSIATAAEVLKSGGL